MTAPYILNYLLEGLAAAPDVHERLCANVKDWDARPPGEDRFTVREALAHIADWEPIWLERMKKIVEEDAPFLPGYDESQRAIDNDYAASDPHESLRAYRNSRQDLVAFLRDRKPTDWARTGTRDEIGEVTLFEMASMVLGHDGYHYRHTMESQAVQS